MNMLQEDMNSINLRFHALGIPDSDNDDTLRGLSELKDTDLSILKKFDDDH